jgi:outer membrane PBP1 activator LpoA protein
MLRLSLGDLRAARRLRGLLLARITLASSDHYAARDYLQAAPRDDLTPRRTLWHQILLAAAIERGNPGVLGAARRGVSSSPR